MKSLGKILIPILAMACMVGCFSYRPRQDDPVVIHVTVKDWEKYGDGAITLSVSYPDEGEHKIESLKGDEYFKIYRQKIGRWVAVYARSKKFQDTEAVNITDKKKNYEVVIKELYPTSGVLK